MPLFGRDMYGSDPVTVTVSGKQEVFSRLERHILYCANDGREVSERYDPAYVARARKGLADAGYLDADGWLTLAGLEAVEALQNRDRKGEVHG
jgi:hypothetical protein